MTAEKGTKKEKSIEIQVSIDGPYLLSGPVPLFEQIILVDKERTPVKWGIGKVFPVMEKCGLCRCGQSKNRPFCDSTHLQVGFDGTEADYFEPYIMKAKVIDGPALKLTDSENLCASARFCHRAGEIWNLVPKSDNPEAKRIAIEEDFDCPSGRLVVWDKKTGNAIEPRLEKSIGFVEDPQVSCSGPIWVRGGIPVKSVGGRTYEVRNRVTLCRCGKSTIKPFCDSSHFPEHQYKELIAKKKH